VLLLATAKSPVEDSLLPKMCNCGSCVISITWRSITSEPLRSAGRVTRLVRAATPRNRTVGPVLLTIFRLLLSTSNTVMSVEFLTCFPQTCLVFQPQNVNSTRCPLPSFYNDTETIHANSEGAANSPKCHTMVGQRDCYRSESGRDRTREWGTPVPLPPPQLSVV
jgi:hypothetical protein